MLHLDVRHLLATVAVFLPLLVAGCADDGEPASEPATDDTPTALPTTMAALGDSITTGYNACDEGSDCPSHSWSTGTAEVVNSHARRLDAATGHTLDTTNEAEAGARMADLVHQAARAADYHYVTILMGANDACTATEAAMTPVDDLADAFEAALDVLTSGDDPDDPTVVFVASVPDLHHLWSVGRDEPRAVQAWAANRTCPTMLADATSDAPEAQQRRQRVRDRVIQYNAALDEVCSRYQRCRSDGGRVFDHPFELEHLSPLDHFHPSALGHAVLAEVTYRAGYDW